MMGQRMRISISLHIRAKSWRIWMILKIGLAMIAETNMKTEICKRV
jgi:hypothetical protein